MINQAFRDMIATLLPTPSEQDAFFDALQSPLKKSISINRHRQTVMSYELWVASWNNDLGSKNQDLRTQNQELGTVNFENQNPDFVLGQSPFFEFGDTKYVDRDDTTLPLGKTRQHLTGQYYIQEVAASLPANILKTYLPQLITHNPQPLTILDTCAAPWGKTAQIASYLLANNIPGIVWGNDVDTKRLVSRASNIQRCGLYNTVATKMDASRFGNLYPEYFDAILVDAPCSGEGTGFKSDAAYKRRKQESINSIVWLQEHIVTSAIKACKVWGIVIYSTCTLNPFENEIQIAKLIEKYGDALEILPIEIENKSPGVSPWTSLRGTKQSIDDIQKISHSTLNTSHFLRARPHIHHTGWFFVCAMRKKSSTLKPFQPFITEKKVKKNLASATPLPYTYNKNEEKTIVKLFEEAFGISIDLHHYTLINSRKKIMIADPSVRRLIDAEIRLHECGIPLLKSTGRSYSLEHEAGLVLWHLATRNVLELSSEELQSYALGEDLTIEQSRITDYHPHRGLNNYIIITHRWQGVSVSKYIDGSLKNKFFKW